VGHDAAITDDCASTALAIQCKMNAHASEQFNYVTKADFRSWVEEEVNQDSWPVFVVRMLLLPVVSQMLSGKLLLTPQRGICDQVCRCVLCATLKVLRLTYSEALTCLIVSRTLAHSFSAMFIRIVAIYNEMC
jgi:hypothetical protein